MTPLQALFEYLKEQGHSVQYKHDEMITVHTEWGRNSQIYCFLEATDGMISVLCSIRWGGTKYFVLADPRSFEKINALLVQIKNLETAVRRVLNR